MTTFSTESGRNPNGSESDSTRNPNGIQTDASCARAGVPVPEQTSKSTTPPPSSKADVVVVLLNDLRDLGINNPEQFAPLGAEAIAGTIRWFAAQQATSSVGPGLLARELRRGGKPGWDQSAQMSLSPQGRTLVDEQREYGESIAAWLTEHLPDLDRPGWGPHPAAIAAVIRIHHRDGKTALSKGRHAAEIRQAVRDWVAKWGE
jgi:hypothetical protein